MDIWLLCHVNKPQTRNVIWPHRKQQNKMNDQNPIRKYLLCSTGNDRLIITMGLDKHINESLLKQTRKPQISDCLSAIRLTWLVSTKPGQWSIFGPVQIEKCRWDIIKDLSAMKLSLVPGMQFFCHLSNLGGKMGLIKHTSHWLLFTVGAHCTDPQSRMTV